MGLVCCFELQTEAYPLMELSEEVELACCNLCTIIYIICNCTILHNYTDTSGANRVEV